MNIFSIEVKLYSGRDSLVYHEPIKFEYDGRSRDVYKYLEKALDEIEQYRALGTVEELRIAKEKQIPKKPNDEIKTIPELDENGAYIDADISVILLCPICGNQVGIDDCIDNYCSYCGQKLDRSDSD